MDTARPKVAPYLGIGWGHQGRDRKGLGLIADLGVSLRAPTTTLTFSDPLRKKLDILGKLSGNNVNAEIERRYHDLSKGIHKVKLFPHLEVGFSYHF